MRQNVRNVSGASGKKRRPVSVEHLKRARLLGIPARSLLAFRFYSTNPSVCVGNVTFGESKKSRSRGSLCTALCGSGALAPSDRHGSDATASARALANGTDPRRVVGFALFTHNGGRGDGVASKGESR